MSGNRSPHTGPHPGEGQGGDDMEEERKRSMASAYVWLSAIWPISIALILVAISRTGGETIYHMQLALSGSAAILMAAAVIRGKGRWFFGGILLLMAALSLAIAVSRLGLLPSVLLFTVILTASELTVQTMRISSAKSGSRDEMNGMLQEFMRGPGLNIVKTGLAVLFISTGILLLIPAVSVWTSSVYIVMLMAAAAGLAGYYLLTWD